MKILFMLPARSGSKGITDKNIKNLNGRPLMYYAINAILNSKSYAKHECYVMVNTDSSKYSQIAEQCGAKVPFLRDAEMAKDDTPVNEIIADTMNYFEKMNCSFDVFAMVQVTSPLITGKDIDSAVMMLEKDTTADGIVSVTESEIMPLWCNTLPENLSMGNFISKDIRQKNRQELPAYYRITGAIRMARWEHFKRNNFDWYEGNVKALVMEQQSSVDIDTELDFELAKIIMKGRENI